MPNKQSKGAPRKRAPKVKTDPTAREILNADVTENPLLKAILDYSRYLGYYAHHCWDSRICYGDPGLPDGIILGYGRLIACETKVPGNSQSPAQREWERRWRAAGGEFYLWYPDDWIGGAVERILLRGRVGAA